MLLAEFTTEIVQSLIHGNKSPENRSNRGRTSQKEKYKSIDPLNNTRKKATIPLLSQERRFDQTGHWPWPKSEKKHYRKCPNYYRVACCKCNIYVSLVADWNHSVELHNKETLWIYLYLRFSILIFFRQYPPSEKNIVFTEKVSIIFYILLPLLAIDTILLQIQIWGKIKKTFSSLKASFTPQSDTELKKFVC